MEAKDLEDREFRLSVDEDFDDSEAAVSTLTLLDVRLALTSSFGGILGCAVDVDGIGGIV